MRIIGGKYRSRLLKEFAGEDVRPTSDRAREALFNILALKINGARVLDLFSGSGALGIESLSRGAKEVVFNDYSKDSVALIKSNLATLKIPLSNEARVSNYDFSICLDREQGQFDLIFIDPPYKFDYGVTALEKIAKNDLLSDKGVAVYERDRAFEGEIVGLEKYDERRYGKAVFTFFRKQRKE
ncbi:MAG: 16S rRNA (guanine(966)-N(2))-methyltransferase RsmD [Clostridiales bacterium]|nr:16S rRNA (guanine(966)-N(2))-methyltransferase RsmD [Clostridiales bacterium]